MNDQTIAARIDRLPMSPMHRRLLFILAVPLFFDVGDIFTFSNAAPALIKYWHVTNDDIALATASGFLGIAIGGTLGGILADRIGRIRAMMLFTATFSFFSLANGFVSTVPMLVALRFLTGLGIASATVSVITYIAELYPATVRGRWQSWAMVIALMGITVTSWVARLVIPLGENGWRWIFVWGAFGLPFLVFARRMNESPRWLLRAGRTAEAEASLERIEAEVERTSGPLPAVPPRATKPATRTLGWSALFSPTHIRPTVSLCAIWFFQTIGFYGFMSWVPTLLARQGFEMVHSLNYITLINLGALPGALFAVFLSERWERKYSIVGVSLAIALFGLLYGLSFTPVAIVIFGFLAATMMDTFSALAFSYTPEQFPTDVRNSGTGLAYGVGRLANVINPFIVSAIFADFGYRTVFAYIAGAWVVTALIALAFGMKTTGRTLETISDEPADPAGLALTRAPEAAQ
ncbi:MAG TPA: MFS transporter [Alphaproteobacteria bacterium]|jgi:putative MFS transporter|nr:MFS transporter [Alphaproteobacteria bacterium]